MNTLRLFTNFATELWQNLHVISQQLKLFSTFSSVREEIHEQEVNLDNLLSFHGNTCSRYPSQGTQVMLTQETKEV